LALGGLYLQNDILGAAMQATVIRNDVISNNIANAEVPSYKRKGLRFESVLREHLDSGLVKTQADLEKIVPQIWTLDAGYSYRLDGNNVDIQTEMSDLYQNSVRYDVLAGGIMNNYRMIQAVINGIK